MPSMVAMDAGGRLLVGDAAAERLRAGYSDAVGRFKSAMGTDRRFTLGERQLDATSLSALVLREMREMATEALGTEVDRAVISVPAWFREPQRRATLDAAHLAGIEVLRLVNEPTAAALHHGLQADAEPRVVAVLDLGGGTFDLTLLELFDGVADVLASVGDVQLGGEDATDLLVQHVARALEVPPIDPTATMRLRLAVERAKRALSFEKSTEVDRGDQRVTLDRGELEQILQPWTRRLRDCVAQIRGAGRYQGPDEILLVGGAARMPLVRALAEDLFGVAPRPWTMGDTAIALGAAIQAGLVLDHAALSENLVSDVLTHSLGVAVCRQVGETLLPGRFDPILSRGTTLPASVERTYWTLHHTQTQVRFQVFEGEQRIAMHNQLLGELVVDELEPLSDQDTTQPVEVRFTHDANGLLEVDAAVPNTDLRRRVVLNRSGAQVSEEDLEARLTELAPLKTHPRDLLPNRWIYERATRVLGWLGGSRRARLDALLDHFEAAMEQRDTEAVERLRIVVRREVEAIEAELGLELDP